MDFIRKLWPLPFKIRKGDIGSFLIQLIVFLLLTVLFGWLISLFAGMEIIGPVIALLSGLLSLYTLVGVILCILRFFAII